MILHLFIAIFGITFLMLIWVFVRQSADRLLGDDNHFKDNFCGKNCGACAHKTDAQ